MHAIILSLEILYLQLNFRIFPDNLPAASSAGLSYQVSPSGRSGPLFSEEWSSTKTPAVALRRRGAVFVEPVLVAEVEYRAWTNDGKLRHASFKGIREREDDAGCLSSSE